MPVKGELLLYVLSAFIIWYMPSSLLKFTAIMILIIWYAYFHCHSFICFCIFLCCSNYLIQDTKLITSMHHIVQVDEIHPNYIVVKDEQQKAILYGVKNVNYDMVLQLKGKWKKITSLQNFYGFSFEKWCNRKGIYYQMNAQQFKILKKGSSFRNMIYERVQSFDETSRNFVNSFLFGTIENTQNFGYLMQVSGFHITTLFLLLQKLFKRFEKLKCYQWLAFIIGFFLVSIGKDGASIQRVVVFQFVSCLPFQNKKDQFAFSMILCILLFPYQMYEYGFLLACSIRFIYIFFPSKRKCHYITWLLLIPFQLFVFYECNLVQLCFFPIYRFVFSYAYLFAWIIVVIPFLGCFIGSITDILNILLSIQFSMFLIEGKPVWIWYSLWIIFSYRLLINQKKYIVLLTLLLAIVPYLPFFNPFGEVMMIDVGQGDCFFIRLPFNQGTMLIDVAGSLYKNVPKQVLQPILKAKGVHAIDLVLITHNDYDHSGGLNELKAFIPVKKVIKDYQPYLKLRHQSFVMPIDSSKYDNENDRSLILYGRLGKHTYLFTGDASQKVEKAILRRYPNLVCDVLKLGHHGSNTSSSALFLQQLNPQLAMISAGKDNRYHHPHPIVMKRLKKYQIHHQSTADTGALSIYYTPWFSFFMNTSHEFGFLK